MYEDLRARGKEIQAEGDEATMKCRWVKQQLHGEFDIVREVWLTEQAEAPVDLDIHGSVDEADHASIIREAEEAAGKLLEGLDRDEGGQGQDEEPRTQADDGGRGDSAEARGSTMALPAAETRKPQSAPRDRPLVDPPEFGDRVKDLYNKDPHWIPGAFPTIFQNETGDPYNAPEAHVDLVPWGPHVMRSKGWAAQAHTTFMYWWMNFVQRIKVLSAKKWYVKDNPSATGYTADDLKKNGRLKLGKADG